MADNRQEQGNKNAPGRSQNQDQEKRAQGTQGTPSGRNIESEQDDDNEEGTKMPGRETRTPTAGKDQRSSNQQQGASFSSEQGQNDATEQNRSKTGSKQTPDQGI